MGDRRNLVVVGFIGAIFLLTLPRQHGWGKNTSWVVLFISAEYDDIEKSRKVDQPIDSILVSYIHTNFMKNMIWKCQGIHLVWIASLVNNIIPLFGHNGNLVFFNLNSNFVDSTWGWSRWYLHSSSCGSKNIFGIGILWNWRSSQGGVGLNSIRGIRDFESEITEYWLGIILSLLLDVCLGWCGLQGLAFTILFLSVLVLVCLIYLSWSIHILLPACIPKTSR